MSAFVQDKAHIDALVALAVRGPSGEDVRPDYAWYGPRWENERGDWVQVDYNGGRSDRIVADELGRMLWAENVRSVQYRYPDTLDNPEAMPGPCDFTPAEVLTYSWPLNTPRLTAVDGLCAISGYEYQACEHPGWMTSEAYRFCGALRRSLCGVIERRATEGMWSIDPTDLGAYRARQLGAVTA